MNDCVALPNTWDSVLEAEKSHVFLDQCDEGVRFLILRGPVALCAYVGIPKDHPLAGRAYDDIPLDCHGGLTFASEGRADSPWAEEFYWYGWDYGHSGDYATYYDTSPVLGKFSHADETKWTPEMVRNDAWSAINDFKKLAKLVEAR